MPTRPIQIGRAVVNVTATLALAADKEYSIENQDTRYNVRVAEAAAEPDPDTATGYRTLVHQNPYRNPDALTYTVTAGESLWMWCPFGQARVTVDEEAG